MSLVDKVERQFIIAGCYVAYMIIGFATLFEFIGHECPKSQDLFFCVIGVCMFSAAGVLSIRYYQTANAITHTENIVCAKGALSLCNVALYLICGYIVFRR